MKYLEWAGAADAGHFKYYDAEDKTNKQLELGEFKVNEIEYTIRGFDEATNSPIYSNDIKSFNDEEFVVKSKGGTLFEGKYAKEAILALGAKLHIKATIDFKGEEMALYLKGMNYYNFSNLIGKDGEVDITKHLVKFNGSTDEKAGAVKYKAPVFVKGNDIGDDIKPEDVPFS